MNPEALLYICEDFNQYDFNFLCTEFEVSSVFNFPTFGNNIIDEFFRRDHMLKCFSAQTAAALGNAVHAHSIVFISKNVRPRDVATAVAFEEFMMCLNLMYLRLERV